MNWKVPDGCHDPLMVNLGKILEQEQALSPDIFPNLRGDEELVIASDYSGEHQGSRYSVFAYLLTDLSSLQVWERERVAIRREFVPDGRRMAFKNLADARRQMVLYSFLNAAGKLNGILFCVAIDKMAGQWDLPQGFLGLDGIKAGVREKIVNVFLYGSFLIGGLSRAGQTIRWITDDDEIVSNESTQQAAMQVMGSMLTARCTHGLAGGALGIASKFEDGRRAEDLCAVPDLVAGAFSEYLTIAPEGTINEAGLYVPKATMYSTKTTLILGWLSTLRGLLKQTCCLASPNGHNGRSYRFLSISTWVDPVGGPLWTPPDKGWKRTIEGWGFGRDYGV